MQTFLAAVILIATFPLSIIGYNGYVAYRMAKDLPKIERDPVTGIMKGAEPVFLDAGESKAALLVHGMLGSPTDFGRLPELLHKQGYTVSVPLLPGHGTNPRELDGIKAEEWIRFVRAEYLKLKEKHPSVVVIGMSTGASISILAAVSGNGSAADKLVLIAPYFRLKYFWYYLLRPEAYQKAARPVIPYVKKPEGFKQVFRREIRPYLLDYTYVSTRGANEALKVAEQARREVSSLQIPTLILHSRKDRAVDYETTRKVVESAGRPEIRLVTLENSNHILLWDYDAEEVENEILRFVSAEKKDA